MISWRVMVRFVAIVLLLLGTPLSAGASTGPPGSTSAVSVQDASLDLSGSSSLHRYSTKAHGLQAVVGIDGTRAAASAQPLDLEALIRGHFIKAFELVVPVDKLSSGERGLDANMHKALKGDLYREIRFSMDSYDVLPASGAGVVLTIVLHGRLSLAGVERRIDISAAGVRVRDALRFSGSKDLSMADYRIKPPTLMLGVIKTADIVTVKFEITLRSVSN